MKCKDWIETFSNLQALKHFLTFGPSLEKRMWFNETGAKTKRERCGMEETGDWTQERGQGIPRRTGRKSGMGACARRRVHPAWWRLGCQGARVPCHHARLPGHLLALLLLAQALLWWHQIGGGGHDEQDTPSGTPPSASCPLPVPAVGALSHCRSPELQDTPRICPELPGHT